MTRVLQISDTHFGTEVPAVVGALCALHQALRPDLVLLTGDITQRATTEQFERARRFVASLSGSRLIAVPGNHDIPLLNPLARLFSPYRRYRRVFGAEGLYLYQDERLLLVGVNTVSRYRHKDGVITPRQVSQVSELLADADREVVRVVAAHHPIHVIRASDEANLLRGADRAATGWADAGADLVLGGHIHLPFVRPLRDRFADLSRDVWVVQAGTAVSSRTRDGAGNSVMLLIVPAASGGHRCTVQQWDYDAGSGAFQQHSALRIPLA
ncbi:MAG: metallophosphoesterase [Burkholderiaceae bacterium]